MMSSESVQLTTSDGPFTLVLFRPATSAPLPPVLLAMDGFGPRETLCQMARRIAAAGYVVGLPDLYHRVGSILDLVPAGVPRDVPSLLPLLFSDLELRRRFRDRYFASATQPAKSVPISAPCSTICAVARMFALGQPVSSATAWRDTSRCERRPSSAPSLAPSPASTEAIS